MGVPVVTLTGEVHATRVGYELLDRIGLGDLATADSREYVETASRLAHDRNRLRTLRFELRDRMSQSTLLDPVPLVREMEAGYIEMWQNFVEGTR
jgi:predicted O-linked N-acetylglucosamine transferase (SPINDLY family)